MSIQEDFLNDGDTTDFRSTFCALSALFRVIAGRQLVNKWASTRRWQHAGISSIHTLQFIPFATSITLQFILFVFKGRAFTMASHGGTANGEARTRVEVEAASDSEDEYRNSGVSFGHYPGAEMLAIRNNHGTVVMASPRVDDDTPAYIKEHSDGTVTIKLDGMDSATRIRISTVMSMYAEDATHFAKCMGFSAVLSDLLKQPRESIALELSPGQA